MFESHKGIFGGVRAPRVSPTWRAGQAHVNRYKCFHGKNL